MGNKWTNTLGMKKIPIFLIVFAIIVVSILVSVYIYTLLDPANQPNIAKLTQIAERGDGEACWCLYIYYMERKDNASSVHWLEKGANCGYARAQTNWSAHLIYPDNASPKMKKQGIDLLIKAANQDDVTAQATLGREYLRGENVVRDIKQSVYWYRRAAQNGDSLSMLTLSQLLLDNQNDSPSLIEAYSWAMIGKKNALDEDQMNLPATILSKAKKLGFSETTIKQTAEIQTKKWVPKIPSASGDDRLDDILWEKCKAKAKLTP